MKKIVVGFLVTPPITSVIAILLLSMAYGVAYLADATVVRIRLEPSILGWFNLLVMYYVGFIFIGIPYFTVLNKFSFVKFRHFVLNGIVVGVVIYLLALIYVTKWTGIGMSSPDYWKNFIFPTILGIGGPLGASILWLIVYRGPNKSLKERGTLKHAP